MQLEINIIYLKLLSTYPHRFSIFYSRKAGWLANMAADMFSEMFRSPSVRTISKWRQLCDVFIPLNSSYSFDEYKL